MADLGAGDLQTAAAWGGSIQAARSFCCWKERGEIDPLNIAGCSMIVLPEALQHLATLTEFYFYGNHISSIPSSVGQLTALTVFHCAHNDLSALPPEMGRLEALVEICCAHNQLTALPVELLELPRLEFIDTSNNRLEITALCDVADGVRRSASIEVVFLGQNPGALHGETMLAFAQALRSNSTLTHLLFTPNGWIVTDPPEVGKAMLDALERNERGDLAPEPYHPLVKSASKR